MKDRDCRERFFGGFFGELMPLGDGEWVEIRNNSVGASPGVEIVLKRVRLSNIFTGISSVPYGQIEAALDPGDRGRDEAIFLRGMVDRNGP